MKFTSEGFAAEGGRFECPKCGDYRWGTSAPDHPDWSTAIGVCNGCSFRWLRTNDKEVFVKN